MRTIAAVELLSVAFIIFRVTDGAVAAPFTVGQSTAPLTSLPVSGDCNSYNTQVAQHGAPLNGDHVGYCQYSSAQIMLNGVPFDDFWRGVSNRSVPTPYRVAYSLPHLPGICATATNLNNIKISMQVQTSRLDWAGAVGPACVAEWNRHSPVTLAATPTSPAASNAVQALVQILSKTLPKSIQSCVSGRRVTEDVAFADLASKVRQFMLPWVVRAQSFMSAEASGQACNLHCNVCSSGWAGTITLKKDFVAKNNGQHFFAETDTYYVGGTVGNQIWADWTAFGGGDYSYNGSPPNSEHWDLSAESLVGQCGMTNVVCFQALNHPNNIEFTQPTAPAQIANGIHWTENGHPQTPAVAWETQIFPHITTTSPTDTTADGTQQDASCSIAPPMGGVGMYTCTQVWEWHLAKQP
jgi:hypothetical protein